MPYAKKAMAPHSSTLAWKIQWMRSLGGCSPWGRYKSDMTEWLHFHFSLSCIGGRNGNPLQYSCLDHPRDGGAWWAAVCGVAQSRTRLKQLSSSSSQSIGASASVFPVNIQGWFPFRLVWSPWFPRESQSFPAPQYQSIVFGTQPSLRSNSHICTWLLEKP